MSAGRAVTVGILGPLQVESGGNTLGPRDFGGRKPKQLLEILALHRGVAVHKERLAELLWGERQPRDAMRTLEAYVSVVRHVLGRAGALNVIRTGQGSYRLDTIAAELDLTRFDRLTNDARSGEAVGRLVLRRRALALVRGELLADEPYADWAAPLRGLYQERWRTLMLDTAEDCLAVSDPGAAAAYCARVLEIEPTRERAHRLLVAAHYAAGEQDLALAAYHRCLRVLDDELGVRPLPTTEAVFRAVLEQPPIQQVLPRVAPAIRLGSGPATKFARNGETTIAYQVLGDGPVDLVFAHGWFSHAEIGWEEPRYAGWLRTLARDRRLIVFDRRGMGMSDPAPAAVTLADRADDVRAVLDAAGSEHAVAFGSCGAGPMMIALSVREPQRVAGLALSAPLLGWWRALTIQPGGVKSSSPNIARVWSRAGQPVEESPARFLPPDRTRC